VTFALLACYASEPAGEALRDRSGLSADSETVLGIVALETAGCVIVGWELSVDRMTVFVPWVVVAGLVLVVELPLDSGGGMYLFARLIGTALDNFVLSSMRFSFDP